MGIFLADKCVCMYCQSPCIMQCDMTVYTCHSYVTLQTIYIYAKIHPDRQIHECLSTYMYIKYTCIPSCMPAIDIQDCIQTYDFSISRFLDCQILGIFMFPEIWKYRDVFSCYITILYKLTKKPRGFLVILLVCAVMLGLCEDCSRNVFGHKHTMW